MIWGGLRGVRPVGRGVERGGEGVEIMFCMRKEFLYRSVL